MMSIYAEPISIEGKVYVDILSVDSSFVIDLRYATDNNFTGKTIYDFQRCYLLKEVAECLSAVQKDLKEKNLRLKIWDAYRPLSAQQILWDIVGDDRYVAPPWEGGRHTRGTAVDLTLINAAGEELKMPTPFDTFSELAHSTTMTLPVDILQNRKVLHEAMKKHKLTALATEWWHFDYDAWESFPPVELDLS